jgi:signal transduction histidine kinase
MKLNDELTEECTKCEYCELVSMITINTVKKFLKLKMGVEQLIQNSIFSAMMMTNLINDLLDLGKLENNAFQLNIEEFNLYQVIQEAYSIVLF